MYVEHAISPRLESQRQPFFTASLWDPCPYQDPRGQNDAIITLMGTEQAVL